jgi:hypothetical protein
LPPEGHGLKHIENIIPGASKEACLKKTKYRDAVNK